MFVLDLSRPPGSSHFTADNVPMLVEYSYPVHDIGFVPTVETEDGEGVLIISYAELQPSPQRSGSFVGYVNSCVRLSFSLISYTSGHGSARRETGVGLIPRARVIRSTHGERGDQTRGRTDIIRCLGQ